jgi:hypothetical protein
MSNVVVEIPTVPIVVAVIVYLVYRLAFLKPPQDAPPNWKQRNLHLTLRYAVIMLIIAATVRQALGHFNI